MNFFSQMLSGDAEGGVSSKRFIGFASFIMFHYAFSKRNDTEYWKYVTNEVQYNGDIFPACEALNYYKDRVILKLNSRTQWNLMWT